MHSPQSDLRFLPPPFHPPAWGGPPRHERLSPKISSACLYASRRKDRGCFSSSCPDFEAAEQLPAAPLRPPGLVDMKKDRASFALRQQRRGPPPLPNVWSTSLLRPLQPPTPPCQDSTSAASTGHVPGGDPSSSSPSHLIEKREDGVSSSLLIPSVVGSEENKREDHDEAEEEEEEDEDEDEDEAAVEENRFLQKAPSLDRSKREKTSQGGYKRSGRGQKYFPFSSSQKTEREGH